MTQTRTKLDRWAPLETRRRKLWDTWFLPLDPPYEFTEPEAELVEKLTPPHVDAKPDADRAKEILDEAQAIFAAAEARVEGAERRATTLQGAVAVATSLLLAGGALLADPSKVRGDGWRVAFACALVAVVFCLVASGARALAATSRIHRFHRPTATNILDRAQEKEIATARLQLAAETLKDYGYNTSIAAWKVAYFGAAAWWFRRALLAILILAALIGAYGIVAPETADEPPPPKHTTAS